MTSEEALPDDDSVDLLWEFLEMYLLNEESCDE
jgi:hypothetical protein